MSDDKPVSLREACRRLIGKWIVDRYQKVGDADKSPTFAFTKLEPVPFDVNHHDPVDIMALFDSGGMKMDPTANLEEQLEISKRMLAKDSEHIDVGDAVRLAELVDELNEWILNGGRLPTPWWVIYGGGKKM